MDNQDQICLFDGDSLSGYLGARQRAVAGVVEGIHQQEFLAAGDEAVVKQVVDQLSVAPLVLDRDQMQTRQTDTKIRMMVDGDDYGRPVRREELVHAYKLSYVIPFSGEALLWQLNNGPRGERMGSVDAARGLLTLTFENATHVDSHWYQRQMRQAMADIDRVIHDQGTVLAPFHRRLAEAAASAVARRRRRTQV